MLKLTITLEENDTGIAVAIESGSDADCKKATTREYILCKTLAKSVSALAPILAHAAENEEIVRAAKPMLESFKNATINTFGKSPKEMLAAAKEARERGEDIGDWLHKLAEDHEAESKEDAPADEKEKSMPDPLPPEALTPKDEATPGE